VQSVSSGGAEAVRRDHGPVSPSHVA
jgi:hypothetical protein